MSDERRALRMGRRQVLITLAVTLLAVGGSVLAVRIAPEQQQPARAAVTGPGRTVVQVPPPSTTPNAPRSSTVTPPPTSTSSSAGPRTQFADWVYEVAGWLDIPERAMRAYASATVRLENEQPACNLSWVTLAGVGKIASDHGRIGDRTLNEQGVPSKPVGTVTVRDFSGNVISSPAAAGPMQLGQSVWNRWAASASGGEPDVQDIDDAALTAGYALCAGERDLATGDGWVSGLSVLQDAPLYIHRVLATATVYGTVGQNSTAPDPQALRAVTYAISKIGLPYVWGGDGKKAGEAGFDCSGLSKAAYASAGVTIPRTAHWQYEAVPHVPRGAEPELGDLIFYGTPAHIHHVGIYIGNNQMIDAPTFGQAVQVHPYRTPGDDFVTAGTPMG